MNLDEDIKKQKLATVPFLLNLASLSQTLLKAMTSDVLQICKSPVEITYFTVNYMINYINFYYSEARCHTAFGIVCS